MIVEKRKLGTEDWFVAEGMVNNVPVKGYSTESHAVAIANALKCPVCKGVGHFTVNAGMSDEYEQKCECRIGTGEEDNRDR